MVVDNRNEIREFLASRRARITPEFRTRWAAHNVRYHHTGRKHLHHPVVGDLQLMYEVMDLSADPGLSLVVYSAEPGSASQDGLNLLATWAATLDQLDQAETAQAPDEA